MDHLAPTKTFQPADASYPTKLNDCAIRAFSIAAGRAYDEVWKELQAITDQFDPKNIKETGTDDWAISRYAKAHGMELKLLNGRDTKSLSRFLREDYEGGEYVIGVTGHMTAVVDGKVVDTWNCSRCKVDMVIKI